MNKYFITISGGLTEHIKNDTIKKMQLRADKALYIAKKTGKNKIEVM